MENINCLICCDNKGSLIIFGNCGHKMCIQCTKKLINKKCPFCRRILPNDINLLLNSKINNYNIGYNDDIIIDDDIDYIS